MLQRSQMLALPVSGVGMGLLTALLHEHALGSKLAWAAGLGLGVALGVIAAWVAYRSDGAARHTVGNGLLYGLALAPMLGGACLVLAQMAGMDGWLIPLWIVGVATVLLPMLGPAWQTRLRLVSEGVTAPWARQNLDLRAGLIVPGALSAAGSDRPSMSPWIVGALAVNLPLAWRLQGGAETGLLAVALALLVVGVVWGGVAQAGPALGRAWFVLEIERRTGQRLRNPEWAEVQAMRRSHWLARWFMRDA